MARKRHFFLSATKNTLEKVVFKRHLGSYTGDWRIPDDGVHDVPQINKILDHLHPSKCGFFSTVFNFKQYHIRHALHQHCYWVYRLATMGKKEQGSNVDIHP